MYKLHHFVFKEIKKMQTEGLLDEILIHSSPYLPKYVSDEGEELKKVVQYANLVKNSLEENIGELENQQNEKKLLARLPTWKNLLNEKCYKAMIKAIEKGFIEEIENEKIDFQCSQTGISYFFKTGEYTKWRHISENVTSKGNALYYPTLRNDYSKVSGDNMKKIDLFYED
ncbi:hypothetical protein K7I13_11805 [Brucepastera parasyntrophica]|uniref:hypothetical protein n=1 Tax=Brucepastera parasyntrophica TaxID=2880008 RepID=UPI0021087169|nr:hypothetical protein [Brucepastera parasyntrophica]ULQ59173.1 hypothetical protein K7I13_11805 [Brucepastera parasyntrophica]